MPCSSEKNSYLCTHVGKRMNFYKNDKTNRGRKFNFLPFLVFSVFSLFVTKKMINFANVSFIE